MIHSEDQNLNPVRNGIYPIPEEVISACLEPDETPEIPYGSKQNSGNEQPATT
jgi:hypothetical protein